MAIYGQSRRHAVRARIRRIAVLLIILLAIGGSVTAAVRLRLFTIQTIAVRGAVHTLPEEIIPKTPPFSYFVPVRVDNPKILSADIEKRFFSKTMIITVTERERYGIWCADATRCFWFDRTGFLFDTAAATRGTLVRNIHDMSGARLGIGDIAIEARFVPNLVGIFDALEQARIPVVGMKLEQRETQEIIAETAYGPPLLFSLRIDPQFTREALRKLKDDLPRLAYADFRSENRVFFEYKK